MLADEEQPLLVQLNWHKDDREGRFLLRRMDETTYVSHPHHQPVAHSITSPVCCITLLINSFLFLSPSLCGCMVGSCLMSITTIAPRICS